MDRLYERGKKVDFYVQVANRLADALEAAEEKLGDAGGNSPGSKPPS